ncbi:protein-tyrosine phosphatase family protein [Chitinophaga arvensicola]|uniref:protein-tyrosine phosphatase family protein n=1 Tax=Chitinophaga arvensicola TaxID=29529 RepID=UPI000B7FC87E|nr:protein-tyrosine phosphatase family protein [Chitinophaga arvensicola]
MEQFPNGGRLGIMARPRGNDWLESEILHLKQQGVKVLVSLLETHEVKELELRKEESYCTQHGVAYINFPIKDRGIPENSLGTTAFLQSLAAEIDAGHAVCIHCRMGIGRSSLIAGGVLLLKGHPFKGLLDKISRLRDLKVPDTTEQEQWLQEKSR